jgi:hypothetical protein
MTAATKRAAATQKMIARVPRSNSKSRLPNAINSPKLPIIIQTTSISDTVIS